jgi:prolyl 4-hydroxylase
MLFLLLFLGAMRGRVLEGMTPRINIPDMRPLRVKNFDENQIYEFENFLTKEECEALIAYGSSRVKPSMVVCSNWVNCPNPSRTSENTFVKDSENNVAEMVTVKVERVMGINRRHFEDLQIVHYDKGKEYKEHWDACVSNDLKNCDSLVIPSGQRYATFLIYLNDEFEAGETCFPRRNKPNGKCTDPDAFKVRPKQGKAVLFFNLEPDGVTVKDNAIHAGLPPSSGEKWMCNKWIRTGHVQ